MSTTLAGTVFVRNGNSLDYCWQLAVKSLLPVCDQVIICDSDSTDGTREEMAEWFKREPKLVLCNRPWDDPNGMGDFVPVFTNYARSHTHCLWSIALDADEVLHEDSYREVRESADARKTLICQRINFWKDAQHTIPRGKCISHEVVRVGDKGDWMPSDFPSPESEPMRNKAVASNVKIMHYGFLRKREAFFVKNRSVSRIILGTTDKRIDAAEAATANGGSWMDEPVNDWNDKLEEFHGTHPEIAKPWLRDRGWSL